MIGKVESTRNIPPNKIFLNYAGYLILYQEAQNFIKPERKTEMNNNHGLLTALFGRNGSSTEEYVTAA